jgi:NAD(P)-dependent dehydrogenase (short-subunit alcohol dehydrogenase family)
MSALTISNLFSVANKTVVVSGGSRGIGYMIAEAFVSNGAKVYISSRKASVCDAAAEELSKLGACISIPADLATSEGRLSFIEAIQEKEESIDVLVNNAGAAWGATFENQTEATYDKVLDINVKSMFFVTQGLLPLLKKAASPEDPSRVINIGSIDGLHISKMDTIPYGVSKAAVHQMSKSLAVKLGGTNITVNAIAPGPFESKMTEAFLQSPIRKSVEQTCPMKRIGYPADMAGLVLFLSSKAGNYINGAVIPIDGGIHMN